MPSDRDAEALLDAVFAMAPVGLAVWDAHLRYVRVNVALAAMNGRPVAAHLGARVSDVLPELAGGLEPILAGVLETGRPVIDLEIAGRTPAQPGSPRAWRASFGPVRGQDGAVRGVVSAVVEVTAEREAIRHAHEARGHAEAVGALLNAMIEATPVGLAFWDPDLRFLRVNEALAAMNGRALDEHLGRTVRELLGEPGTRVEALLRRVLETREPVLDAELRSEDGDGARHWEASYFPVVAGDVLLGVGGAVREVTERFRAEQERGRLLQEALAGQRRAALLAEAAERVSASLDLPTALGALARTTVPALADWCAITIVDADGALQTLGVAHADPGLEPLAAELSQRYPPRATTREGVTQVIRTGRPEAREEIDDALLEELALDERHLELLRTLRPRRSLTVPLRTQGRVLGAAALVMGASGRRFGPEEVALAADLASRAALHVDHARLYTERSRIAATLEASLRPRRLPEVPGLELAARYRAAGEANEVGGDFYDVVAGGPGRFTAVVGDVAGKGPSAAALTALARHTLRAAALAERSPAQSLALLNEVLLADTEPGRFCTAVHAELSPGPHGCGVRLANGGHPAPFVRRADGAVERLDGARGPLVGALPAATFAELEVALAPGDLLLLYTDGVVEVPGEDAEAGERRLVAALAASVGDSVDAAVASAEEAAVERHHGVPRDDLALLAIAAVRPRR